MISDARLRELAAAADASGERGRNLSRLCEQALASTGETRAQLEADIGDAWGDELYLREIDASDPPEIVSTRAGYVALFETLSEAQDFESSALSIGRDLLPWHARAVLDGEDDPHPAYWHWLAEQVDEVRA